jgi:DNA-binding transcriptional LysR family regulator
VFRAIMVAGSVSGAGRLLHVSQPAISRVLALTESRLGFQLFERKQTRFAPTPEARRLFTEVEGLYQGVQRVNDLATNLARSGAGSLRIVSSASLGERLVPLALQRFEKRNPGVRINFRNVTYDELTTRFLTGDADIGISLLPPEHASLAADELGQDEVVCLMAPDHPLAGQAVVDAQALAGTRWIGYPAATPLGHLLTELLGADLAASAQVQVHTPMTAIAFAQQGLGAALVDRWSLPVALRPGMVVRPLQPTPTVAVWATYSKLESLPLLARRFLAAVTWVLRHEHPSDFVETP